MQRHNFKTEKFRKSLYFRLTMRQHRPAQFKKLEGPG